MRGFPFGIRRQDFATGLENPKYPKAQEMPNLSNSSSGSSSSHDGNTHRRSKKHHHHGDAPDNSIMRGAEILRRQLLSDEDSEEEDELYGVEHAPRINTLSMEDLTDENLLEEAEEWSDPWTPRPHHARVPSVIIEEGEEKTAFSSPVRNAAEWARLSDDEGDEEGRPRHHRTTDRKHHHSKRISPEHSPESCIRDTVRNHFSLQAEDDNKYFEEEEYYDKGIMESQSNQRSYLPGGLIHKVTPEHQGWGENTSEAVSRHALDLLKDLESEERALQSLNNEEEMSYLLDASRADSGTHLMTIPVLSESPKFPTVVSPRSRQYDKLQKDPAYQHAQRAGLLWQSILSQHVRFPMTWWNGARSPPMGCTERRMWTYMGRHRIAGNPYLNGLVRSRGSAGRLVLHIVVRDIMTMAPVQDIAVGCFHPNARGIRTPTAFDPTIEESRDIWVALRKRVDDVSLMESLLKLSDDDVAASPLGAKHAVDNTNMKAVFGETPPVQTVFVMESELYEVFSHFMGSNIPPAAILLGRYLKEWY
eukprot:CAMPEP_0117025438 /NCGR_PEP_ID=MMETSP0472-20121206/18788_1 /TAXON_ID=693140 ORGANISM="Tiarina fusus, Strain LIS" /NCGR_SAMPLE_ID=MMETSP0472 /ASSEMBLY_ACC=CAM_ASM_000603 /LENGTH=532 /DNA_ID=CAMNT_0004732147 /DNA_START=190 /DNA_END=1788 /DNA_ORIENTATION=-